MSATQAEQQLNSIEGKKDLSTLVDEVLNSQQMQELSKHPHFQQLAEDTSFTTLMSDVANKINGVIQTGRTKVREVLTPNKYDGLSAGTVSGLKQLERETEDSDSAKSDKKSYGWADAYNAATARLGANATQEEIGALAKQYYLDNN